MIRRVLPLITVAALLGLLLAACGGELQQTVEEIAPTIEAAAEELAPTVEAAVQETQSGEEAPAPSSGLPDLGGREITIAVENAYLPFNYIDPDTGEPAGWDYDVWNEICSLLNCTPVYIESGWEGMIQAVADGQFDAAADGITITEDRAEIVDFSEGYINIEQRLLVRLDEDRIESIEDIAADESLVLGTQVGTTNYETAAEYLDEGRIQAFEQFPFAVQALIAGDIDAVIIDEVAGQGYLGENADLLTLVGPSMSSDQLGFIYPLGSDLVDPINAALNELKGNGFLESVNLLYFGPEFDVTYDDLFPEEEGDGEEAALPDLGGREISIAVENAYLPFNYIDPDTGEPAGWDYVVWEEICNLINCTPVYIESGWEGMIQAVADGQFDAAADGITITEDRAEIVDFSEGYINIDQRLLVRLDEDRIESIEDIAADENLVLGTQVGTTNYETATEYLDEGRIQAFEQFPFAVQALIAGDIDAVIIDEVAGQGYLGENADLLKLVGPSMSSDQLGFIYPLGSDLVDPVNAALNELMSNGFLQGVNAEFFGPAFDVTYDDLFPEEESALPDLEGREIAIAVENAYLPFNYIDPETGEPAGWDYVVWDEICNLINCTPVYIESGWEGMIQAVADGQFDAAADGITITDDRAEIVDFSEGYINIDQRLLVRLDEDRIESIEDIAADENLVLGTQVGTTNYETATEYLDEGRIQAFEQFPFAVQALIAGDIDAVIIDEVAGQGYLGENADLLKLVGPSMSSDQLGFIYPLGSDLVDPVNAALNELKANGFLEEVNLEFFGPGFTITYDDLE